jgi:hypothetical protein
LQVLIGNGEVQYNADGGLWFRVFTGLFFVIQKMYWEGLLYQFLLPYMVNNLSSGMFVAVQIVIFIVFLVRRFLFDINRIMPG